MQLRLKFNRRLWYFLLGIILIFFALVRFINLSADFPVGIASPGLIYTDEGWWTRNAVSLVREGSWYLDDGYNPIVNLPTVPLLQSLWLKVFGVSLASARALSATCTVILSGLVYLIVRREIKSDLALLAPLIILCNYPVFVYGRLALSEMPMMVLVLISLWLAIDPSPNQKLITPQFSTHLPIILSALFLALAILAKTTAVFALPMIFLLISLHKGTIRDRVRKNIIFLVFF